MKVTLGNQPKIYQYGREIPVRMYQPSERWNLVRRGWREQPISNNRAIATDLDGTLLQPTDANWGIFMDSCKDVYRLAENEIAEILNAAKGTTEAYVAEKLGNRFAQLYPTEPIPNPQNFYNHRADLISAHHRKYGPSDKLYPDAEEFLNTVLENGHAGKIVLAAGAPESVHNARIAGDAGIPLLERVLDTPHPPLRNRTFDGQFAQGSHIYNKKGTFYRFSPASHGDESDTRSGIVGGALLKAFQKFGYFDQNEFFKNSHYLGDTQPDMNAANELKCMGIHVSRNGETLTIPDGRGPTILQTDNLAIPEVKDFLQINKPINARFFEPMRSKYK